MAFLEAAAILGSTALGVFGARSAADTQASAARQASQLQADATQSAIAEQRRQFDVTRQDLQPFRAAGEGALEALLGLQGLNVTRASSIAEQRSSQGLPATVARGDIVAGLRAVGAQLGDLPSSGNNFLGFGSPEAVIAAHAPQFLSGGGGEVVPPGSFQVSQGDVDPIDASINQLDRLLEGFEASPGFEFRRDEALDATDRFARARGTAQSGGTLMALQDRADALAGNEFNNFAARRLNRFDTFANRLASLAGVGQTATNTTAALGANAAANIGSLGVSGAQSQGNALQNAAAANASGTIGSINAVNRGLEQISPLFRTASPITGVEANPAAFQSRGTTLFPRFAAQQLIT